jgi:hypothetical protein
MSHIPEDILNHIYSHLQVSGEVGKHEDDYEKLATLASICLCSKTYHRIALPHLYVELDTRANRDHPKPFLEHGGALNRYLRTVVERPAYRSFLQRLRVGWFRAAEDVFADDSSIFDPDPETLRQQLSVTKDLKASEPFMFRERLEEGLSTGLQDAKLALLLCLCPEITFLQIACVNAMESTLLMSVVGHAAVLANPSGNVPLQKVKEVNVRSVDGYDMALMSEAWPMLRLPSLTTLRARGMDPNGFERGPHSRLFGLKHVYFDDIPFDGDEVLDAFLSQCRSLETLAISYCAHHMADLSASVSQIGALLNRKAKLLRRLTLYIHEAGRESEGEHQVEHLRNLDQLEELIISWNNLSGDVKHLADAKWLQSKLPVSLRTLRILNAQVSRDIESDQETKQSPDLARLLGLSAGQHPVMVMQADSNYWFASLGHDKVITMERTRTAERL